MGPYGQQPFTFVFSLPLLPGVFEGINSGRVVMYNREFTKSMLKSGFSTNTCEVRNMVITTSSTKEGGKVETICSFGNGNMSSELFDTTFHVYVPPLPPLPYHHTAFSHGSIYVPPGA